MIDPVYSARWYPVILLGLINQFQTNNSMMYWKKKDLDCKCKTAADGNILTLFGINVFVSLTMYFI